jgi:cytochrome c556
LNSMSNSRIFFVRALLHTLIVLFAAALALAQNPAAAPAPSQPPVAYASVSELNSILAQLQQTAQSIQSDLAAMRIEKWKTDGATKKQTLADVESIQRNLQSTLPETIAQLNNSPEDLGTSFKLYRNLDALYSVFGSVVELAGAFGSKDDFQSLDNDLNGLKNARRSFGDRMQKLTASKEDELTRLRAQVKTLTAAPPPPPKKIVVDDAEPAKKPVKKKVTTPKPPAATTTAPPASAAPAK